MAPIITLTEPCKEKDNAMKWTVYLSGEIHTDWREQIMVAVEKLQLPIEFCSAVTDHQASDAAGDHLGEESDPFWRDHKSAKVNAIRSKNLLDHADIAVIRFGEKYKQWNAAFDAGYCAANGTPYITLHDDSIIHPLKEVDAAALAWAKNPAQVVETLRYVVGGN
jgi:YtoQ family protein